MITVRIFRQYIPLTLIILAIIETLVLLSAPYVGTELRFLGIQEESIAEYIGGDVFPRAVLFTLVIGISMTSMGLYQRRLNTTVSGHSVRIVVSFLLAMIAMSLVFYVFPTLYLGRGIIGLAFLIGFLGVVATRAIFFKITDNETLKRRVLILGTGTKASTLIDVHQNKLQRGFTILGYVPLNGEHRIIADNEIIPKDSTLAKISNRLKIDEIVVAVDDRRKNFPLDELLDCKMRGIEVVDLQTFFVRETGKIKLDLLHPSWLIYSDGFGQSAIQDYTKRSFDVFSSLLLLAITFPIMILTVIAIWLEDRGPIFFRQTRIGLDSNLFQVIKFRSMRVDAEGDGKARWAQKNDSRITKVGSFIRKVRIDELPQIFNVLKGDMSFVGPRPERPEFVEQLSKNIPYFNERHRVRPGITGWAQICYPYGASEKDAFEKLQYDLYYAKHHNIFLDSTILLQTVEVILFGKGAR